MLGGRWMIEYLAGSKEYPVTVHTSSHIYRKRPKIKKGTIAIKQVAAHNAVRFVHRLLQVCSSTEVSYTFGIWNPTLLPHVSKCLSLGHSRFPGHQEPQLKTGHDGSEWPHLTSKGFYDVKCDPGFHCVSKAGVGNFSGAFPVLLSTVASNQLRLRMQLRLRR